MSWKDTFSELSEEEQKELELIAAIIAARKKQDISQRDLAKMTGLKQSTISRMEKSIASPRLETFIKIARALKMDLNLIP